MKARLFPHGMLLRIKGRRSPHIVVTGQSHGLPYSKGLMASSIMAAGLNPAQAFGVAEKIEQILNERGATEVSSAELRELASSLLAEIDQRYADSYLNWQAVEELDVPLVIMIGGAAGVGKSTIATQLAARLGITRVISTDSIREVLRAGFSQELMPALYVSSFEADEIVRVRPPTSPYQGDLARPDRRAGYSLIVGFQEQVSAVSVGIKALIARALEEGTDIIVEGAHVVPGFLEGWEQEFKEAVLVPVVITVSDEELHRFHFWYRAFDTRARRPRDRYLSGFDKIRTIQRYITQLAVERGVPVLEMSELDATLQEIGGIVVAKALDKAQARGETERVSTPGSEPSENGGVVRRPKLERLKSWEFLGSRKRRNGEIA
ncbi:MAG: AAA family ATPase [Actinomycetota bacterium]